MGCQKGGLMDDEFDFDPPDENDELFDELDKFVEISKNLVNPKNPDKKFDIRLELMDLILEEVPENARIYQQYGGNWIAEAKYHNMNFICIVGNKIPEIWNEILGLQEYESEENKKSREDETENGDETKQ